MVQILHGDVIDKLRELETESVHLCVTSIPYWDLRCYGIEDSIWGGSPMCTHEWGDQERGRRKDILPSEESTAGRLGSSDSQNGANDGGRFCVRCSAWRGQLGLEPTPELFLDHIVTVFQHVRRVLRPEATLWVNIGDSYANPSQSGGGDPTIGTRNLGGARQPKLGVPDDLKAKDLCMMPARVALALQADGWYLRSQIPWIKANCMPESTTDRPTSAIEYIYQFSKNESCYYDREAVRIAASSQTHARGNGVNPKAKLCGANSRLHVDRDPAHQTEADIRHKQNRSFSAAVTEKVQARARRNSDWLTESFKGLLPDENGDPLAMLVNPQPFSIEMCKQCRTCYQQKEYRKLAQNDDDMRVCACGAVARLSHFATFPEKLVEPIILAGSSEYGACSECSAPYERIVEKAGLGDWPPNGNRGHDRTEPNQGARANLRKHAAGAVNGTAKWAKENAQSSGSRMIANVAAARAADNEHDNPFPAPATLGWRPTCSHPLFPQGEPIPCTVLDPFGGSGTTSVVAERLGRDSILIDRNEDYLRMAEFRMEQAMLKQPQAVLAVSVG
jgi:DNA modification methylase